MRKPMCQVEVPFLYKAHIEAEISVQCPHRSSFFFTVHGGPGLDKTLKIGHPVFELLNVWYNCIELEDSRTIFIFPLFPKIKNLEAKCNTALKT